MVDRRYAPSSHFVWLDEYVGQFKSLKPWHFMGCYHNLTSGCVMIWSFFGIGHRKRAMMELRLSSSSSYDKNN
jgi:hypothetical protein